MSRLYTVYANYFATGEGMTIMVLYTRGYGKHDDPTVNAMERFTELFGDYLAQGAEIHEGLNFDLYGLGYMVGDQLREKLVKLSTAGGFEYHASLHYNLS